MVQRLIVTTGIALDNEVQDDAMVVKYESTGMTKSRRMFVKG